MSYEVESRGKKMHMNKNIARLAVTAGLTAALSFGGVMAPVTMAFAEGATTTTNSITINKYNNNGNENGNVQYKAYRIFKADVVDGKDGSGKVVSNIDWASPEAKNAVLGYLSNVPESGITASSSAQAAAKYLTDHADGIGETTPIENSNLFNGLAKEVEKSVTQTGSSFAAGNVFTPQDKDGNALQGYYLFVTDGSTLGTEEKPVKNTGTSPIFAVVGDALVTVNEKTSIPTVEKKIKNDNGSDWADKADSQMGQDVKYQLTGTVADNIATFGTYYYEFHDELSAGLTADVNTIVVTIDGVTVEAANNYTPDVKDTKDQSGAVTGQVLTVSFGDLKVAARSVNKTLTKDSHVVVTYKAKLDPKKAKNVKVGGDGNLNSVRLIYSNNPMSDGRGESVPDTVRDYTYALKLVKEDFDDHSKKLENVEFTIKATGADELASGVEGTQFVQGDGSLGDDAHRFTTDSNGVISVKGLDAGTYTVEEVKTPGGYNTVPKFTFTIKADGLGKKEGEVFEGASDPNTLKITGTTPASDLVNIDGVQTDGTVTLTVKNKKGSNLPLTGLNGVTFTWIAGGAVLCIGVAHLIRSRKQAEESEQE